jgi:hypothetical protein
MRIIAARLGQSTGSLGHFRAFHNAGQAGTLDEAGKSVAETYPLRTEVSA